MVNNTASAELHNNNAKLRFADAVCVAMWVWRKNRRSTGLFAGGAQGFTLSLTNSQKEKLRIINKLKYSVFSKFFLRGNQVTCRERVDVWIQTLMSQV